MKCELASLETTRRAVPQAGVRFNSGIMNLLLIVALHLGKLHPIEKLLVAAIAFGPFVVLGIVVYVVRKRDIAEEEAERAVASPLVEEERSDVSKPAGSEE